MISYGGLVTGSGFSGRTAQGGRLQPLTLSPPRGGTGGTGGGPFGAKAYPTPYDSPAGYQPMDRVQTIHDAFDGKGGFNVCGCLVGMALVIAIVGLIIRKGGTC